MTRNQLGLMTHDSALGGLELHVPIIGVFGMFGIRTFMHRWDWQPYDSHSVTVGAWKAKKETPLGISAPTSDSCRAHRAAAPGPMVSTHGIGRPLLMGMAINHHQPNNNEHGK